MRSALCFRIAKVRKKSHIRKKEVPDRVAFNPLRLLLPHPTLSPEVPSPYLRLVLYIYSIVPHLFFVLCIKERSANQGASKASMAQLRWTNATGMGDNKKEPPTCTGWRVGAAAAAVNAILSCRKNGCCLVVGCLIVRYVSLHSLKKVRRKYP